MSILSGRRRADVTPGFLVRRVDGGSELTAYRRLRRETFVDEQGLFTGDDHDEVDDDPRAVVLVATGADDAVLGGVRLSPHGVPDIGWWTGSRLVVARGAHASGIGAALVRAACAHAQEHGVLRFEATVQRRHWAMFTRLGWTILSDCEVAGVGHSRMRSPIDTIQSATDRTKSYLAEVLAPLAEQAGGLGPPGFRGDDGVPVPGGDTIAACDAIIPSMVERDPEWAGWCSVLVNLNDLAAMGARPTGLLDAVGAPTRSVLTRIVRGIAHAAAAWDVPVLGGHTQVGVPASLSVTALGTTTRPIRAGGASVGDRLRLIADLDGRWRPGHHGTQWDSTTGRSAADLRSMNRVVADLSPRAAKDVSMAGLAGTAGMLAEASGAGVELDVTSIPRPDVADMGSWLTCFPGFAMLTADRAAAASPEGLPNGVRCAEVGVLVDRPGVRLRWPDGATTTAVAAAVTGLGRA
ncbi:MSMEG_0567/sll0787 family protein [Williamsia sterculiae]|nr:MSMEG_0567/sll0787 family protein [Williamsia sterculiae]